MSNEFVAKITAEVINKQIENIMDCIFLKDVEKDIEKKLKRKIEEYIESKILEFSYLVPLALDEQIELKKLYYPLTLSYITKVKNNITIDKFKIEIFEESSRIIIEDSAGMGKTTLLRYMYLDFLKQKYNYIPIFLELRSLNDEIGLEENILKIIKEFSNFNDNNLYIITTRKEQSLNSLSNYIKMKILELEVDSGVLLLKNYIQDLDFFSQLEKEKKELKDFLSTPLLATLIYKAYKHGKSIPKTKSALYEQVYEALYSDHDICSKNGFRREIVLNKNNFQRLLAYFSFDNFKNIDGTFQKFELIEKFLKVSEKLNFNINLDLLITNLIKDVPLFLESGRDYFWKHKSMQEFFIAIYIMFYSNNKENYIEALMRSESRESYLNILEFIYSYDNNLYKKSLYKLILEEEENQKKAKIKICRLEPIFYEKDFKEIFGYQENQKISFIVNLRKPEPDIIYSLEEFKYTDLLRIIVKKENVDMLIPKIINKSTPKYIENKVLEKFKNTIIPLITINYHEKLFTDILSSGILNELALDFAGVDFKGRRLNFDYVLNEYIRLCKQDEEKNNIEDFIFNNL